MKREEKVVVFDFDHTLINSRKILHEVADSMYKILKGKIKVSRNEFDEIFYKTYEESKEDMGYHSPSTHIIYLIEDLNLDYDVTIDLFKAYESYYYTTRKYIFDGVYDVLDKLSKRCYLILVTGGEKEHQMKAILCSGVYKYFDHIYATEFEKDYEILEEIIDDPKKIKIMYSVGDKPLDIKFVREYCDKYSIKFIGIRARIPGTKYYNLKWKGKEKPDYVIEDIKELLKIIK